MWEKKSSDAKITGSGGKWEVCAKKARGRVVIEDGPERSSPERSCDRVLGFTWFRQVESTWGGAHQMHLQFHPAESGAAGKHKGGDKLTEKEKSQNSSRLRIEPSGA